MCGEHLLKVSWRQARNHCTLKAAKDLEERGSLIDHEGKPMNRWGEAGQAVCVRSSLPSRTLPMATCSRGPNP